MVFSIQNCETGEVDYIHYDLNTIQKQDFDEETGEPLNGKLKVRYVKHKNFHIPKKYLRGTPCEEWEKKMTSDDAEAYYPPGEIQVTAVHTGGNINPQNKKNQYDKDYFLKMESVKNEIVLAYNKSNIHIFLIPSIFFFNIYFALLLMLIEGLLHFVAHKRNGLNSNRAFYYRSPLHILTSQFCAICRSEAEMEIEIFNALNKHMRKARESKTLKDVSKVIS